jgi:AcrR family transcriptional regulator
MVLGEFQRARLMGAALQEASQRGCVELTVSHIVARARVSRKTFYEIFDSREDCLAAVFEEAIAHLAAVAAPAYASEGMWPERLRRALAALLTSLEGERDLGAFALARLVGDGSIHPQLRARVLERLRGAVEDGRRQPGSAAELSPLTAEVVVAGVLAVVHARLRARTRRLSDLLNPLMWTIVLPYLGPAAAAAELGRTPPSRAAGRARPVQGALDGLDMRVTYRTATVLSAIAEQPGASNVAIAARAQVTDQGQISKLLARLAGLGLVENTGAYTQGVAKAWRLTPRGSEVASALTHNFAAGVSPRARRRGA